MKPLGLAELVMGPGGLATVQGLNGGTTVVVSYLADYEPGMTPFTAPQKKVAVAELRPPTREDVRVAGEQWLERHPGFVLVAPTRRVPA